MASEPRGIRTAEGTSSGEILVNAVDVGCPGSGGSDAGGCSGLAVVGGWRDVSLLGERARADGGELVGGLTGKDVAAGGGV